MTHKIKAMIYINNYQIEDIIVNPVEIENIGFKANFFQYWPCEINIKINKKKVLSMCGNKGNAYLKPIWSKMIDDINKQKFKVIK
jgi:hypothetical protein